MGTNLALVHSLVFILDHIHPFKSRLMRPIWDGTSFLEQKTQNPVSPRIVTKHAGFSFFSGCNVRESIQKASRKEETLCSLTALTFEVHSPISTLFYNSPKPTFPAYGTWIQLKARTPL